MKTIIVVLVAALVSTTAYANPWFEANRRCKNQWETNKHMLNYCIDKHVTAYNNMPSTTREIEKRCDDKWGTDWSMKKYCIEQQNEAKSNLESSVGDQPTEKYCREKWGSDYRMVEYCLEKGIIPADDHSRPRPIINSEFHDTDFPASSDVVITPPAVLDALRSEIKPTYYQPIEGNSKAVRCPECSTVVGGYDKSLSGRKAECLRCRMTHIFP